MVNDICALKLLKDFNNALDTLHFLFLMSKSYFLYILLHHSFSHLAFAQPISHKIVIFIFILNLIYNLLNILYIIMCFTISSFYVDLIKSFNQSINLYLYVLTGRDSEYLYNLSISLVKLLLWEMEKHYST